MNTQKTYITLALLILVFGLALTFLQSSRKPNSQVVVETPAPQVLVDKLCFYNETSSSTGFGDVTAIKIDVNGDKISGEVKTIPGEKDSKVGKFDGSINGFDTVTKENTSNVWWDTFAEGMSNKEELLLNFSDRNARIAFGEMVDRGDGVYVYKDKKAVSWVSVPKVDCAMYDGKFTDKPTVSYSAYNTAIVLPLGQTLFFKDGLTVELKAINDSRCKTGVQCVWQGELAPVLSVKGGKLSTTQDVNLGTVKNKSMTVGAYTFSLKSATPTSASLIIK